MSATNYDDLQKQIIDWSHRNDLGTKIPDFISLAEDAMYYNSVEVLTIRAIETTTLLTHTGKVIDLPDNFESARKVSLDTEHGELTFQAPEQMKVEPSTGKPKFYTIIGNQIELDRVPDTNYSLELSYFKKADSLSDTVQTNEILDKHSSIYLYGSLAQLFAFAQDDQQSAKYGQLFMGAIRGANKASKKGRYGTTPSMSLSRGMIV